MARKNMSKPIYTIKIYCSRCGGFLYRYQKEGPGKLVKCYTDRIVEDRTQGDRHCPNCHMEFARRVTINNRPAHKIIQGKVFTRGHSKR